MRAAVLVRNTQLFAGDDPRKHKVLGPEPGGTFWCLQGGNDLPPYSNINIAVAELGQLLRRCRVWVKEAGEGANLWKELFSVGDLPEFSYKWRGDYDSLTARLVVSPFMPEFYVLPKSGNGRRQLGRSLRRAGVRTWEEAARLL